jgi:hypothetical protein
MQEPERLSNQRVGLGALGPRHTVVFTDAVQEDRGCARCRLLPSGGQFGLGLSRSAPLAPKKDVHLKSHLTLEHRIDRPGQFMRQDAQGFAFVMFFLQAGQIFLPLRIIAQEQRGRFAKGPFEVGVADFRACSAYTFAAGFLAALDQTAIRGAILHPWKAVDAVDVAAQHEAENLADTGDGLEQYRVLASCCLAVLTMESSRSLRRSSS